MTDNQFGTLFGFTSFGESHGKAIGCVVDGVPPNLAVTEADIQPYLDMLQSTAKMYKKYLPRNTHAQAFADFILSLNNEKWNILLDNIPQTIIDREAFEFDQNQDIKTADLQKILDG